MKPIFSLVLASLFSSTLLMSIQAASFALTSPNVQQGATLFKTAEDRLHVKQYAIGSALTIGLGYVTYKLFKHITKSEKVQGYSPKILTDGLKKLYESHTPATTWRGWGIENAKSLAWDAIGSLMAGYLCDRLIYPVCNRILPIAKPWYSPWARTLPLEWFIECYIPTFGTCKSTLQRFLDAGITRALWHQLLLNAEITEQEYAQQEAFTIVNEQKIAGELEAQGPAIAHDIQYIIGALSVIEKRPGLTITDQQSIANDAQILLDLLNMLEQKNYDDPMLVKRLVDTVKSAITVCDKLTQQ